MADDLSVGEEAFGTEVFSEPVENVIFAADDVIELRPPIAVPSPPPRLLGNAVVHDLRFPGVLRSAEKNHTSQGFE